MLKEARADNVKVLDVRPRQCDFTDEMVLATARSKLHCQTAAQAVVYRVRCSSILRTADHALHSCHASSTGSWTELPLLACCS